MRKFILCILSAGILLSAGVTSYAAEETKEPVTQQAPSGQEGFEAISTMMKANDEANVRSGPGKEYKRMGRLEVGQDVFVLGRLPNDWYQISYENGNAYVACEYLEAPVTDEALAEEIQARLSENLAQISEADTETGRLKAELAAAREETAQAQKAAEKAMAELAAQKENVKAESSINPALLLAGMFAAVFIGGLVLVWKPDLAARIWKTKDTATTENAGDDDGLELISLNPDEAEEKKELND